LIVKRLNANCLGNNFKNVFSLHLPKRDYVPRAYLQNNILFSLYILFIRVFYSAGFWTARDPDRHNCASDPDRRRPTAPDPDPRRITARDPDRRSRGARGLSHRPGLIVVFASDHQFKTNQRMYRLKITEIIWATFGIP
jgi:hypothetical protein